MDCAPCVGYMTLAISTFSPTRAPWPASLFVSRDGGDSYKLVQHLENEGVAGVALTALGGGAVPGVVDYENTVDVEIGYGELENRKLGQVTQGCNIAEMGGEVFGFMNAEPQGDAVYRLSGLIRGMSDTEAFISSHAANETFTLLDEDRVNRVPIQLGDLGAEALWKVVSEGQDLDDVEPMLFAPQATDLTPRKPAHLNATQAGNGDITISWTRVSRAPRVRIFSQYGVPELDSGAYRVEVMDGTTVARTFTPSTTSQVYTDAQQTTDFGSPLAAITFRVSAHNDLVGYGPYQEEAVTLAS